jgi:hypothetical protein
MTFYHSKKKRFYVTKNIMKIKYKTLCQHKAKSLKNNQF